MSEIRKCEVCGLAMASGIWMAVGKRGRSKIFYACADCGFNKIGNKRYPYQLDPDEPPIWVKMYHSVTLLKSLTRKDI